MSKVSVITPVYKTEDFLDKSLPSLTAQTLRTLNWFGLTTARPTNAAV